MNRRLVWLPVVCLLSLVLGCQVPAGELTLEEAQVILDNYLKFRNEGDVNAANAVMHPECVIRYPNLPEPLVGLDAFKDYDASMRAAFPDFKMTVEDFFVRDDKIFCYWVVDASNTGPLLTPMGELPPTNKSVHASGMAVSRVEDGKIVEDVAYFDVLAMMRQLGFSLVPPQPSVPTETGE
jgi:steroid delta-isomerase-like uncharacterized protein